MAVIHKAFIVPRPFLGAFRARCGSGKGLDTACLFEWARLVAAAPSAMAAGALDDLRIDPQWLEPPEGEPLDPRLAFLVILAASIESVPGLSNRLSSSYHVLELILPVLGWSEAASTRLRIGDDMESVQAQAGIDPNAPRYMALGRYFGWLRAEDARALLERLERDHRAFERPTPAVSTAIAAHAQTIGRKVDEIVAAAYADAIEMLRHSQIRQSDVFLVMAM